MIPSTEITCIILAGGAGKRMGTSGTHKVCFPILGRPAIVRAIDTYKRAGLKRFVVVVGQMAQEVMATVSAEHPDVTFVYQAEARGTGHAALIACRTLAAAGYEGKVLVTMGDKVIEPGVIRELLATSDLQAAALAMVTLPFAGKTGAGRVLLDGDGRILGIIEKKDLLHAQQSGQPVRAGRRSLAIGEVEQLDARSNGSLYLFDFPLLWDALNLLRPDNEQGELYLTDTVGIFRAAGREVHYLDVRDQDKVMAFNTPAELLAIEEILTRTEKPSRLRPSERIGLDDSLLKPAGQWLEILADGSADRILAEIYGSDGEIIEEQRSQMVRVVECFIERFGPDRPAIVCRAPGRINLMGRHVEHRGGDVNVMAISRETVVVASPRLDDLVALYNTDPCFPDRQFRISEMLEETSWEDWLEFVDSVTVKQVLQDAPGDWSHYARAPLLRLQQESGTVRLAGMDCVVGSNIPMGAGLSSSSALVVAFAEAAIRINGLEVETADFIDLCGEGEWFVGSRGGNGDHAAIRVSRIGSVSHLGFFPFTLKGVASLPADWRLVVADSAIQAKKSAGAKDAFNHRIGAYRIGQILLQKRWPAAAAITHLRDLAPEHLGVHVSDVYRALKLLPEWPTRADLRVLFSTEEQAALERIFASHADVGPYDLRGVVLYGLAECARSARFADLLLRGDVKAIGAMMAISHDGDRVAERISNEECRSSKSDGSHVAAAPFVFDTSDFRLDQLAAEEAELSSLPGAYACSTPEIDFLTDLATSVEGVVGAQLSGAGLGGCVMILVHHNCVASLEQKLTRDYYQPRQLKPRIYVCQPVQGAGLLSLDEKEALVSKSAPNM
jgi:N-acetylgalactosamine kinase